MKRFALSLLLAAALPLSAAHAADDCADAGTLADGWQKLADDFRAFANSEDATQDDANALMTRTGKLTQASAELYSRTQEQFAEADHFGEVLERLSGADADEALTVMEDMADSLHRLEAACTRGHTSEARAAAIEAYNAAVSAAILQHWDPATAYAGDSSIVQSITVHITISPRGELVAVTPADTPPKTDSPLGVSMLKALDASTPLPLPPDAVIHDDANAHLTLAFEFDPNTESYRIHAP